MTVRLHRNGHVNLQLDKVMVRKNLLTWKQPGPLSSPRGTPGPLTGGQSIQSSYILPKPSNAKFSRSDLQSCVFVVHKPFLPQLLTFPLQPGNLVCPSMSVLSWEKSQNLLMAWRWQWPGHRIDLSHGQQSQRRWQWYFLLQWLDLENQREENNSSRTMIKLYTTENLGTTVKRAEAVVSLLQPFRSFPLSFLLSFSNFCGENGLHTLIFEPTHSKLAKWWSSQLREVGVWNSLFRKGMR